MGAHAKTVYQIEQLEAMLLLPIHRPFKVAEGAILSPGGDRQGRQPVSKSVRTRTKDLPRAE